MPAPSANRRRASIPATAESTSTPANTDPMRIGLSLVPNCLIAHSLTGVGVRSMTVEPTASTGDEAGSVSAATRWPGGDAEQRREHAVRGVDDPVSHESCSERAWGKMVRMTDALVHLDTDGARATITLDSQHNRNALSRQLVAELFGALQAAERDPEVRVVLLQATGQVFCSGADLSEATADGMEEAARRIVALQRYVVTMSKPVVVKVHGAVRAGGIGLVAASDVVIADEDATFALTEVKLGLAAAIISLTVHARMNPRAAALTTLGGEKFNGRDAAAYGLVTEAVPGDALDARVDEVCGQLRDRRAAGSARVEGDPQPRPGRPHRRPRGGDGGAERAPVRLRRGPRGDDRVLEPQEIGVGPAPPASLDDCFTRAHGRA